MRLLFALCTFFCMFSATAQDYYLFAGTYTTGKSKGIYVYQFNSVNGEVQWMSNTDSCTNPSFLSVSPDGKFVYAVNETGREQPGQVSAFAFDKRTGTLNFINRQPSGGDDPCFITTHPSGKWAVVANYSGGNLSALPINEDGSLQPYAQLIQHKGSGPNKDRQSSAHVHSTFFSPDYQYILAPDLGMDKVMMYRFTASAKKPLQPATTPFSASVPGSGPRHIVFHPNKKFVYRIEELTGTVTVSAYNNGLMRNIQTIATHNPDFKGQPGSADIHVSPDGKFLYASNRGEENNIAIFSVDANSGKLTAVGYQSVNGAQPRNFIIDPSGKFLLVANQKTNNIVVFRRDIETGLLQPTLQQIEVPNPVCLQFLKK